MATVAILGCGPAGLFAAQAVKLRGLEPVVISRKRKSEIYGAQYLHRPIPGLSPARPDGSITTVRLGRPEKYAERVYGNVRTPTSWEKVREGAQPAWDLRATYDAAWEQFEAEIMDQVVDAELVHSFTGNFDLVISTIPLWAICEQREPHQFRSIPILVKKEMEYTGIRTSWTERDGCVVYNGTDYGDWYRTSYIFGHQSTEIIAHHNRYRKGYDIGFKVAGTNCDCHPNLVKAGRMGLWERGILTHDAFDVALEACYERAVRAI